MYKHLIIYFFLCCALKVFSQENALETSSKIGYIYGASIHNRGIMANFSLYFGAKPTKWVIRLDASTLKNAKETRIRSIYMDVKEGSRFVYDKINRFGAISPTFGLRKAIIPLSSYNKVAIIGEITTGPSIGLLRPYYLNIAIPDTTSPGLYIVAPTQWDPVKYTFLDVVGETNPFRKFSPTKIYAGWCIRTTAYIDMSRKPRFVRGIQVNVDGTIFPTKIPIMKTSPNTAGFLTVGIGLCFGKK